MTKIKAKIKSVYLCSSCGTSHPQWLGQCSSCGEWNTVSEERVPGRASGVARKVLPGPGPEPRSITDIDSSDGLRLSTGLFELDRVLGSGVVPGSAVLIGGDPGIGKSTLLLQASAGMAAAGREVLYVTGEESLKQIRLRSERLDIDSGGLLVYSETNVERIIEEAAKLRPAALVVDSIQTVFTDTLESLPGSVAQLRESTAILIDAARSLDTALFLVGHVTKDGMIAGPRVLEHMVDTVLYFEGEGNHAYRIMRAVKNRYGSVMEIGVFEMGEKGLLEVTNPSEVFLAERPEGASGSAVVASVEGTRTILCEIQALVSSTPFGVPRRTVMGVDLNRVALLAAVLEKKCALQFGDQDIFIKVAGGLKLNEPAVDLGIVASMVSNYMDKPIDSKTAVFGEVGLAGEVRAVSRPAQRVGEAKRLGFTRCILPADNKKDLKKIKGVELVPVRLLTEAIEELVLGVVDPSYFAEGGCTVPGFLAASVNLCNRVLADSHPNGEVTVFKGAYFKRGFFVCPVRI